MSIALTSSDWPVEPDPVLTEETRSQEIKARQARLETFLREQRLDAVLLRRASSFAWATCGIRSYVNTASSDGEAALLVTPSRRHLITTNIEAPRLIVEERLEHQGWDVRVTPWYEAASVVAELSAGLELGADTAYPGARDLSGAIAHLRAHLTPEEGHRMRLLGGLCSQAMNAAARAVRPGQTEEDIAATLAYEAERRGVQAIVTLVATDERVFAFRHPLPTGKTLRQYAMLVLCGRRWGLVCSLTRLVHFGRIPDDLGRKAAACAQVDGELIQATRPGKTMGELLQVSQEAYRRAGFGDEWRMHHQGGAAGYEPREYLALPGSTVPVALGQAFAWNPSVAGAKSEDTILVGEAENEVLTAIDEWPPTIVSLPGGKTMARPAILEVT